MHSREQERMWRLAGRYSALGIEMFVAVTLPTLLGNYLDERFDVAPVGLVVGLVIGIGAAVRGVMRVVRQHRKNAKP